MCVAVIVQSDKDVPKNYLKAMHEANPHGGGVAWIDGDLVHYRKGLTWQEIDALQDKLPRPFLMHFRIATKGDKIPELTHPFPIGPQAFTEDLVGHSPLGVLIHNGTWSDYKKYVPGALDLPDNKISDTQVAAYMAAIDESILDDVRWCNAIMRPNGIVFRGSWDKLEGNLYSNLYWRRELYSDYQDWRNWHGRTYTPHSLPQLPDTRKKGDPVPSHQQNRSQSNGKTVGQGQYQTQYNKSGGAGEFRKSGSGADTVQSNGKTITENRAAKREKRNQPVDQARTKTQPMTYEDAVKTYNKEKEDAIAYCNRQDRKVPRLVNDTSANAIQQGGPAWSGERLFNDNELSGKNPSNERAWNGYAWDSEGVLIAKPEVDFEIKSRETVKLDKCLGPYVPCPDCKTDIKQIPCECGMNSEEKLNQALESELNTTVTTHGTTTTWFVRVKQALKLAEELDKELENISVTDCMASCGTCIAEDECTLIGFNDMPEDAIPHAVNDNNLTQAMRSIDGDMFDVEDMNAYGMGLGVDSMGEDDYLNPDWREINDAIRDQGVKINPTD